MILFGVIGSSMILYAGCVGQRTWPGTMCERRYVNYAVHPMDVMPRWLFRAVNFLVERNMMCHVLFAAVMWFLLYAALAIAVAVAIGAILDATHLYSFDDGFGMGIVTVAAADSAGAILLCCAAFGCLAKRAINEEEIIEMVPSSRKSKVVTTAGEEVKSLLSEAPAPPIETPVPALPPTPTSTEKKDEV
jgi:hypothetical protein